MDYRFVPPDLRRLDSLRAEAFALSFFEDERPLRGALGLVDWRLCGFLSRQIVGGRLSGARGEMTLVPTRARLRCDKLFIAGLGRQAEFDAERYAETLGVLFGALGRARVRSSVWVLPGRATGTVTPAQAMEGLLALADSYDHDEVTLLEGADAQREMESVVLQAKRRARAFGG